MTDDKNTSADEYVDWRAPGVNDDEDKTDTETGEEAEIEIAGDTEIRIDTDTETGEEIEIEVETRTEISKKEYGLVKPPLKDDPNLILKILLGIGGVVIISWVMLLTNQASVIPFFWIAVIVYSVASIKNITVKEKGVRETLSTLDERYIYTGGYYWRWFLFQRFHLFTTEPVVIDIPKQEVLTAKKTMFVDGREEVYAGANIKIDAVLYFFWADTPKGLCAACRKAPPPTNENKLYDFFEPSLAAMIRGVAGDYSWLTVRMNDRDYVNALQREVRNNKEGPISQAGITDFSIENKEVTLPPELEKLITAEQRAALEKRAGEIKADLEKIKIIKEGEGKAEAMRLELEAMAKNPEMARVRALQKMAQGDASTIFVEIPKELSGALSGNEVSKEFADMWNALPKPQRTHLITELTKLGKKK